MGQTRIKLILRPMDLAGTVWSIEVSPVRLASIRLDAGPNRTAYQLYKACLGIGQRRMFRTKGKPSATIGQGMRMIGQNPAYAPVRSSWGGGGRFGGSHQLF